MNLSKLDSSEINQLSRLMLTRRIVDKGLAYIPVILMGVLAMLSYWLIKNTPEIELNKTRLIQKHEIDYELRNFSVKTYRNNGQLKSLIVGERARHFADNETLEIEAPQVQVMDINQHKTTANSSRAISNADGSELQMIGNAVLVKTQYEVSNKNKKNLFELRSEYLDFMLDEEIVKTHLPVQIKKGNNYFEALSMNYDNLSQSLKLKGRVKGQIAAEQK
jgi:lipopolysaccharide export system protein LptC